MQKGTMCIFGFFSDLPKCLHVTEKFTAKHCCNFFPAGVGLAFYMRFSTPKKDLRKNFVCVFEGISGLARKFGLTPDQFGENLRDNYQRHETEQHAVEPDVAAENYLSRSVKIPSCNELQH